MRNSIISFVVLIALGLTGCTSTIGGAPIPSQTEAPGPVARGMVISITRTATITKAQMNGGIAGPTIGLLGGKAKCDVALYAVKYVTIGTHGEAADASAGFYVPEKGCKGPFMLVGYAQGTNENKAMKITDPTKQNVEPVILASIFAAHGYAIAATDYLGLGYSSYPYQPYLVASSEASAVIDSMRAIRHAAQTLHVGLSGKVFLTGYSQGGHSIMATQREIEANDSHEFDVVASSPSSGPYTLTDWFPFLYKGRAAVVFAYALPGFQKVYGNVYSAPTDAFVNPYAGWIDTLLPVANYAQLKKLAGTTLPIWSKALMQPAFAHDLLGPSQSGARVDTLANNLLTGWKPVTPTYLCGGSRDPAVNFDNSRRALVYFTKEGTSVKLLDVNPFVPTWVPITEYHDAVLVLCHTLERVDVLDHAGAAAMQRLRSGPLPSSFYRNVVPGGGTLF